MGHQPRILIWNIKEKKLIAEFKSHKFGVLSLAFSPNMRYLVSIGFQVKKKKKSLIYIHTYSLTCINYSMMDIYMFGIGRKGSN